MILPQFREILLKTFCISRNFVVLLVLQKKFRQKLISRNDFAKIARTFAKHFLYFARFRRVISFAKKISRIFVKYLFREMILLKFRKIVSLFCEISLHN